MSSRPLLAVALLALAAGPARAQLPALRLTPSDPVVDACDAAARAGRAADARRLADEAQAGADAVLARAPRDGGALTTLARVLVQCRIPAAELTERGELAERGIALLHTALDAEPGAWLPRLVLATTYVNLPPFFNRARDAERQLDTLLALQGERADLPAMARPYELRGVMYERAGRRDSALAVWRRGLARFPQDTALRGRLQDAPPASAPPASTPAAPGAASLGAVRVTAAAARLGVRAAGAPGQVALGRMQVVTTPGAMADVYQALQLQPGVTRATDGSDLYTRGGDPAETPTVVDGGRMLAGGRFEGLNGGLFGALDPQVMRAVRFSTGGFSARFGNALSGVLDLETEGRARDGGWRAGLNTVQLGVTGRTPAGARGGAWGSLRASNAAAMLRMHGRQAEFDGAPWSVESTAGASFEPRPGAELRSTVLVERDAARRVVDAGGLVAPYDAAGGTRLVVLGGRTVLARAPVRLRANVALAEREARASFGVLARDRRERSALARVDAEWMPGALTLRAGVEAGALARRERGAAPATPLLVPGAPTTPLAHDASARQLGGYVEGERTLGARLAVQAGVRADVLPGESAVTLDPRAALTWRDGAWTARLATGIYHQGRWRPAASVPTPGVPGGVPTEARHLTAGVEREGALRWRVEAFHKEYGRFAPFGAGPAAARGAAAGVDVVAQRATGGRVSGWAGYSFLRARVGLADGRTVRSPVDVTHALTGVATARAGDRWTLGATARYATGLPYTAVVDAADTPHGFAVPTYGAPLGARVPAYARLDGRLTRLVPTARGLVAAYVEALNVLDRPNAQGYTYDAHYRARRPVTGFFGTRTVVVGVELQPR